VDGEYLPLALTALLPDLEPPPDQPFVRYLEKLLDPANLNAPAAKAAEPAHLVTGRLSDGWAALSPQARLLLQTATQLPAGPLSRSLLVALSGLEDLQAIQDLAAASLLEEIPGERAAGAQLRIHSLVLEAAAAQIPDLPAFRQQLAGQALRTLQAFELVRRATGRAEDGYCCAQELGEYLLTPSGQQLPPQSLRPAVIQVLWQAVLDPAWDEPARRQAALLLIHLHWADEQQAPLADELLVFMEIVGRFVSLPPERAYLAGQIARSLVGLPDDRPQAYLRIWRAAMLGLSDVRQVREEYQKASLILQELAGGGEAGLPDDYRFLARLNLGLGNLLSHQGNLQQAKEYYLAAVQDYRTYFSQVRSQPGKVPDLILGMSIYKETSYNYVLLENWQMARRYYHRAEAMLQGLELPEDDLAYANYSGQVLEVGIQLYLDQGKLLARRKDSFDALRSFQRSLGWSQEAIRRLSQVPAADPEELAVLHTLAGQVLLETHRCSREPGLLAAGRQHGEKALSLAEELELQDLAEDASQLLEHLAQEERR
jgi:tetratricopeptide (TPR) repeat protein